LNGGDGGLINNFSGGIFGFYSYNCTANECISSCASILNGSGGIFGGDTPTVWRIVLHALQITVSAMGILGMEMAMTELEESLVLIAITFHQIAHVKRLLVTRLERFLGA
jgi:hypothetical protein